MSCFRKSSFLKIDFFKHLEIIEILLMVNGLSSHREKVKGLVLQSPCDHYDFLHTNHNKNTYNSFCSIV